MTPEQRLLTALNNLWGEGYNPDTDEEIPKEKAPWRLIDQRSLEESLYQNDNTFMDKGVEVILAAYEFARSGLLTQNSE